MPQSSNASRITWEYKVISFPLAMQPSELQSWKNVRSAYTYCTKSQRRRLKQAWPFHGPCSWWWGSSVGIQVDFSRDFDHSTTSPLYSPFQVHGYDNVVLNDTPSPSNILDAQGGMKSPQEMNLIMLRTSPATVPKHSQPIICLNVEISYSTFQRSWDQLNAKSFPPSPLKRLCWTVNTNSMDSM